ncbi:uncharacterized protein LOC128350546 [Hemicordylus capensis]|uniref:uncharacterized protein LOC128350546 n=1 Tax=Hemicordylus capensis TaxID=884348 RepID=UPI00230489B0|nr:uncharacterized protein LOC128350546 [Hemicordylus capensis]
MERLRHCPSEHQATVNAALAALCRPLFHHEEAKIRRAAMKTHLDLLQHRHHHHESTEENITTLIAVLMHVEDEDLEVAQAAKDNLSLLAEALLWHLEGRLLARDSYSLQELLHKIAKRLIQQLGTEDAVEMETTNILGFFRSEQPSVRRTAALLIGDSAEGSSAAATQTGTSSTTPLQLLPPVTAPAPPGTVAAPISTYDVPQRPPRRALIDHLLRLILSVQVEEPWLTE